MRLPKDCPVSMMTSIEGKDFFGREVFSASQLMRFYFPEGTDVVVSAERDSDVGQVFASVSVSGYLVKN